MSRRSNLENSRHRDERGFTMVELLVTLAVTMIGLTGVMSMHSSSAKANRVAKESTGATAICERTMEELRALPVDDIVATFGESVLPFDTDLTDVETGNIVYTRTLSAMEVEDNPELVLFRVSVYWTEAGGLPGADDGRFDHEISLELVRTKLELL